MTMQSRGTGRTATHSLSSSGAADTQTPPGWWPAEVTFPPQLGVARPGMSFSGIQNLQRVVLESLLPISPHLDLPTPNRPTSSRASCSGAHLAASCRDAGASYTSRGRARSSPSSQGKSPLLTKPPLLEPTSEHPAPACRAAFRTPGTLRNVVF